MSNAAAAYYTYLAQRDRDMVATLRKFGYFASADHVERRAERYDAQAKGAASFDTPPSAFPSAVPHDDSLHMPSNENQ